MYYSALRPAEAANLTKSCLLLPEKGWGELLFEFSTPSAGASWTDSGQRREQRQLKHRAKGETRAVPSPPELTRILHDHVSAYGTDESGRLFQGVRGGELSESTYRRAWRKARETALTPDEQGSPLVKRPYDLRHAAVSTWLSAGVPATQVAEWAEHSVHVLLMIYAKCIAGQEDAAFSGSPPHWPQPEVPELGALGTGAAESRPTLFVWFRARLGWSREDVNLLGPIATHAVAQRRRHEKWERSTGC